MIVILMSPPIGCSENTVYRSNGSPSGDGVIYRDFPVEFDNVPVGLAAQGEKSLTPGTFDEQLFDPIEEGDPVHIIHGFQGGTWVHISVRVTGMTAYGKIAVSLEKVGTIEYDLKLVQTAEGFLEAYDIPIPVGKEGPALEILYGQPSTLEITFSNDSDVVTSTRSVTLEEG